MKKKTSFVWNHFTMTGQGNRAICHHCKSEVAYSPTTMSNLNRHIKTRHPEIISTQVTDETPMEVFEVEEIREEPEGEIKTYEITVKGFEEMVDLSQSAQVDNNDQEWTPEAEGSWKDQSVSTPTASSQKKDRKRSAVWNHFQRSPCQTNATCLHCGRVCRIGTISNLARHLKHRHPNQPINQYSSSTKPSLNIQKNHEINDKNEEHLPKNGIDMCSEVIELNVDNFQNPANVIETRVSGNETVSEMELDTRIITQSSQNRRIQNAEDFDMHEYIKPKETTEAKEMMDRHLVKMIVKGCHPVGTVEQNAFKEFVRLLNPKYDIPTLHQLTNQLIPECYRECESRATYSLQGAEGICLYIDQWKTKTASYMCVTAHFINQECKFESLFLSCHVVNADEGVTDISQRLSETINEWGISGKVVAVVTDNSETIVEAVKMQNWVHIPYFIRSLCLIIHEGLLVIKSIVCKVKNIIERLKKMPAVIAEIYSKQKSLGYHSVKLITSVRNDSSSSFTTLEMLSRFMKLKPALMQILHQVPENKLNESDWRILKSVLDDVFEIFKEVKKEIIKEQKVCMSKIVFFIKSLQLEMGKVKNSSSLPSDAICVATTADTLMEKHFKDFLETDLVSFMLLLDPRMKKYAFSDESEYASACSKLKREVCDVSVAESESVQPDPKSLWFSFDEEVKKLNSVKDPIGKGILELENYLQEQVLERDGDPLVWWEQRKAIYPRLFKLMKKYLCVSTKYTQRESISYKTAYMLSQLKNSNSTSSESELMFLHHNM